MKLFASCALTACLMFVGCAETASGPDTSIIDASNKVEANVQGMDCSGCTGSVCAAVEQVAGVTGAHADLETGDLIVALEDDADAEAAAKEIETIVAGLSKGKYTISNVKAVTGDKETPLEQDETQTPEQPEQDAEEADTDQANAAGQDPVFVYAAYDVKGMDCTGCSGEIEQAVAKIDGVQKVKADHQAGKVVVHFDDRFDDKVKMDEVKQLIASLSDGKYTVQ